MYNTVNNVKLFVKDEDEGSPTLLFMNFWGVSTETKFTMKYETSLK
jgi:hypothetical protein